jgi:hypothetical protein
MCFFASYQVEMLKHSIYKAVGQLGDTWGHLLVP